MRPTSINHPFGEQTTRYGSGPQLISPFADRDHSLKFPGVTITTVGVGLGVGGGGVAVGGIGVGVLAIAVGGGNVGVGVAVPALVGVAVAAPGVTVGVPGPGVAAGEALADGDADAEALAEAEAVTEATDMTVPFFAVSVAVASGAATYVPLLSPPPVAKTAAARMANITMTAPPANASKRVPPPLPA